MAPSDPPSSPISARAPFLFPEDLPPTQPVKETSPYFGTPYYEPQEPEKQYEFIRQQHEREERSGDAVRAQALTPWGSQVSVFPDTPTEVAEEERRQAESRAHRGGLSDSPDDGGPRAVSSIPYRFR